MTAPSRISVRRDGIFIGWRNETDAKHGFDTFSVVAPASVSGHENTMYAPATDKTQPGFYAGYALGADYGSLLRAVGADHATVRAVEPFIKDEMSNTFQLASLANAGVIGGQHFTNGSNVSTSVSGAAHERGHEGRS